MLELGARQAVERIQKGEMKAEDLCRAPPEAVRRPQRSQCRHLYRSGPGADGCPRGGPGPDAGRQAGSGRRPCARGERPGGRGRLSHHRRQQRTQRLCRQEKRGGGRDAGEQRRGGVRQAELLGHDRPGAGQRHHCHQSLFRLCAQPLRSRAHPRRLQRRAGCGGGGADRAGRDRRGQRRIGAHPGGVLRHRRLPAVHLLAPELPPRHSHQALLQRRHGAAGADLRHLRPVRPQRRRRRLPRLPSSPARRRR